MGQTSASPPKYLRQVFEMLHLSDATTLRSVLFISVAGLRGSITLVMVQTVIKLDVYDPDSEVWGG
eukprot:366125-Chlamydomonas_euryale.AAC.9